MDGAESSPAARARHAVFDDETFAAAARRAEAHGRWLLVDVTDRSKQAAWATLYTTWRDPAAVPLSDPPTCSTLACSSGTSVVWANPRALQETGYRQPQIMAPAHVSPTRKYDGPRRRREDPSPPTDSSGDEFGCPKAEAPTQ